MNKAIVYLLVFVLAFGIVMGEEFEGCPDEPTCENRLEWAMETGNLNKLKKDYPKAYGNYVRLQTGLEIQGTDNIQNIKAYEDGTLEIGPNAQGLKIEGYPEINGPAVVGGSGTLKMKEGGSLVPGGDMSKVEHFNSNAPSLGDVSGANSVKATADGWKIKTGEETQKVKAGQKGATNVELSMDDDGNLQLGGMSFKGKLGDPIIVNGANSAKVGGTSLNVPQDANAVISQGSNGADLDVAVDGTGVPIKEASDLYLMENKGAYELRLDDRHAYTYMEGASTDNLGSIEPIEDNGRKGLSYVDKDGEKINVIGDDSGIWSRLTWDKKKDTGGPRVLGRNVEKLTFKTDNQNGGNYQTVLKEGAGLGFGLNNKNEVTARHVEKGGVSLTIEGTDIEGVTNPEAIREKGELQEQLGSTKSMIKMFQGGEGSDTDVSANDANYLIDEVGDRKVEVGGQQYKLYYDENDEKFQLREYEGEWWGDDVGEGTLYMSELNEQQAEKVKNYIDEKAKALGDIEGLQGRPEALNREYGMDTYRARGAGDVHKKLLYDIEKKAEGELNARQKVIREQMAKRGDETYTSVASFGKGSVSSNAGLQSDQYTATSSNPNEPVTLTAEKSGKKLKGNMDISVNNNVEGEGITEASFQEGLKSAKVGEGGSLNVGEASVSNWGVAQNFEVGSCSNGGNCILDGNYVSISDENFNGEVSSAGENRVYANGGAILTDNGQGGEMSVAVPGLYGDFGENGATVSETKTYTVEKDDNLWKIAQEHNVDFERLKNLNEDNFDDLDKIKPGDDVKLPGSASRQKQVQAQEQKTEAQTEGEDAGPSGEEQETETSTTSDPEEKGISKKDVLSAVDEELNKPGSDEELQKAKQALEGAESLSDLNEDEFQALQEALKNNPTSLEALAEADQQNEKDLEALSEAIDLPGNEIRNAEDEVLNYLENAKKDPQLGNEVYTEKDLENIQEKIKNNKELESYELGIVQDVVGPDTSSPEEKIMDIRGNFAWESRGQQVALENVQYNKNQNAVKVNGEEKELEGTGEMQTTKDEEYAVIRETGLNSEDEPQIATRVSGDDIPTEGVGQADEGLNDEYKNQEWKVEVYKDQKDELHLQDGYSGEVWDVQNVKYNKQQNCAEFEIPGGATRYKCWD